MTTKNTAKKTTSKKTTSTTQKQPEKVQLAQSEDQSKTAVPTETPTPEEVSQPVANITSLSPEAFKNLVDEHGVEKVAAMVTKAKAASKRSYNRLPSEPAPEGYMYAGALNKLLITKVTMELRVNVTGEGEVWVPGNKASVRKMLASDYAFDSHIKATQVGDVVRIG